MELRRPFGNALAGVTAALTLPPFDMAQTIKQTKLISVEVTHIHFGMSSLLLFNETIQIHREK